MRILAASGYLEVAPNEKVTVKIVKSKPPYAASKADLVGATWETTDKADELTDVETFHAPTAPASKVVCGIVFDFASDAGGDFDPEDEYTVEIKGNPTEETRTATVVPPPIINLNFTFVVRG